MPHTYGADEQQLEPATLPNDVLTEIGRLVRAFSEIEDIVDLHICNLAEISESKATILLGRTAVTRRIEIAETLAKTISEEALAIHKHAFSGGFSDIADCRNYVAHGKLLGVGPDGRYAFLTTKDGPPMNGAAIRVVASYSAEQIKLIARMAEDSIPRLERHLKVEALRAERLLRPLLPHRRAQGARNAKRKRPPQSSQA
jgi:hypothetical protein